MSKESSAAAAAAAAALASTNAQEAAKVAANSASIIAVVANDVLWMKKSLIGIENKLEEMTKVFVTESQHQEVCKNIEDHEVRLNNLETSNTRLTVMLVIGSSILTVLVSLLIFHLFQK